MKKMDLTGLKFGKWSVVSFSHRTDNYTAYYNCICDCGKQKKVKHSDLKSKSGSKSCGCSRKGLITNYRHGVPFDSPVYISWLKIKDRCYNKNHPAYKDYGGKGVYLAEEFHNFVNFYKYIGNPPDTNQKWTIDRIDGRGSYCIGNIRWATTKQQARNKAKTSKNTSGVTGVGWRKDQHGKLFAKAFWTKLDGKTGTKSFSVDKHGLIPAFYKACMARKDAIEGLNSLGAGYTENHGK